MDDDANNELLGLTAEIVAAHVANNRVATNEVSGLISAVHGALADLAAPKPAPAAAPEPAVPVRSSVKTDYIVCLEDGKKLKMLKRYLRTNYNLTPDEYRTKWNLPRDYPMVAPAYAEQRRGLAQKIGLGRKRTEGTSDETGNVADDVVGEVKTRAKPGRKPAAKKADAPAAGAKPRGRPRKNPAPAAA